MTLKVPRRSSILSLEKTALGAEAQKKVKIMQTGYELPNRTGSKFLNKITSTSYERMSRKVCALYDDVKMMEERYKLSDPRTISRDKDYAALLAL
jgi:hypothetical protein